MKVIRVREPWGRFTIKLLIMSVVISVGCFVFFSRFSFGVDPQIEKCIPGKTVYLIDSKDKNLRRDATYVFRAKGLEPLYKDGTKMVKFLRGLPGDEVEVTTDHKVLVAGQQMGKGLFLAYEIGQAEEKFVGKGVLNDEEYWFMGSSDRSFDSRYWGAVKKEQVIGRAYPLF